MEDFFSPK